MSAGRDPAREIAIRAAVDQHLSRLRDLVQLARDHRDVHDCIAEVPCPGEWAAEQVGGLCHHDTGGLLLLAVAELAALGYGLPTNADAYHLTDLGQALTEPTNDEGPSR